MPSSLKDFKVLAALGKGSYGSVMKVERLTDACAYAVKEVNIRRLSPREREDALNEIRILASIKHRNIVRYCDAFTEKDNLYIVMEFAEGGDIGRQIEKFKKANKYIKEDTIWSYTIQICKALHELHSRNILHRDLKPKNVFLTGKNHVRLGDLGCAKLMKTGLARTQIGTPYYMSPEIWASKPYDQKSDMWALGCIIYELCMLMPPFLANDMNGLAMKVKTAAAPRISKHYSDELAALVAALLNKDPRARPDTKTILSLPAVAARLPSLPDDDESAWAGDDMRSALLATIRAPSMFGYGGKAALNLPAPAYPVLKRGDSAPSGLASVDEAAGASGGSGAMSPADVPMGGAGALGGAGLPPKPSVAVPSAPPARAAFAAATSPPHLGRYAGLRRDPSVGAPGEVASSAAAAKEGIMAAAPPSRPGMGMGAPAMLARAPSAGGGGILSSAMAAMNAPSAVPVPSAGAAGVAPVRPLVSVPSARALMGAPSSAAAIAPSSAAVAARAAPSSAVVAAALAPLRSAAAPVSSSAAAAAAYRPSTQQSAQAAVPTSSAAAAAAAVRRYVSAPTSAAVPSAAAAYGRAGVPTAAAPVYGARPGAVAAAVPSSRVPSSLLAAGMPPSMPSAAAAAKYAAVGGGYGGMVGAYPAMGMRAPSAHAMRAL